jgi:hypothetical protein
MNEPKEPIRNRIKKYIADNEVNRKVKTHFEEHKVAYSIAATAVVSSIVTAGLTIALTRRQPAMAKVNMESTNSGGHLNTINNIKEINIYLQRVSQYGNVIGRPGQHVFDMTARKEYTSITQASRAMDVGYGHFLKHLDNKLPDINGHKFVRL